ncbi:MAG: leucine-rich repeat domain-containing protein [Alistipes sp.]|nr:leucine-rich repeat domain-containing protein [Alistipes sp.]
MKKFLLIAVAAFGMLMTACSKDEVAQPVAEKSTVTFTVAAPELATRADLGDGTTATQLSWAVYDKNHTLLFQSSEVTVMSDLKATVEIPFVNGMEYNILFWAEAVQSPYSVDWANLEVGYTNAAALVSNSEKYDAFYCYFTELDEVTGPVNEEVELKRPFAQLNIKTNDHDNAVKSGLNVDQVSVEISEGCDKFSLANGEGIKAATGTKITFGNATKVANDHLAVNYLFTCGQKSLINVKFSYTDGDLTKGGDASGSMEFAAVPVQRNYRTNIVGSLLTSDGTFEVEIKPGFEGEYAFQAIEDNNSAIVYEAPYMINVSSHDFDSNIKSHIWNEETGVGHINFDNPITTIEYGAFQNCGLTSIKLPKSVTTLSAYAFAGTYIEYIDIPSGVTNIGMYCFYSCVKLKNVNIGENVRVIEGAAFFNCRELLRVEIPDNVEVIDAAAFADCSKLESVKLSANLSNLGPQVFRDCDSLKEIYCKSVVPYSIYDIFYGVSSAFIIYVPTEAVEDYKNANIWRNYADRIVGYQF